MPAPFRALPMERADIERSNALFREHASLQNRLGSYLDQQRNAELVDRIFQGIPWMRPEVVVTLAQFEKDNGGDARDVLAAQWEQQGWAIDPAAMEELENYVGSADFKAQWQERSERDQSMWDRFSGVVSDVVTAPLDLAMKPVRVGQELLEGDIGGAALELSPVGNINRQVQNIDEADIPGVKEVSRTVFTALETPYQEVQSGLTRAIAGTIGALGGGAAVARGGGGGNAVRTAGRYGAGAQEATEAVGIEQEDTSFRAHSTGFIALGQLLRGEEVDLGSGYFPGGEVLAEQQLRARELASIQGRAATPGRLLAYTVTEPGTKPYNALSGLIDAASILTLDPTNLALTKVGEITAAHRTFAGKELLEEAGGFTTAWRKFVDGPTVRQYLDGSKGRGLITYLSGEDDYLRLAQRTNWKLPADTMVALVDETDPVKTRGILEGVLGVAVREQPTPNSLGAHIRTGSSRFRMAQMLPEQKIDLRRPEHATQQVYRWMKNAKVADSEISPVLYRIASARGAPGQYEGLKAGMDVVETTLRSRGVPNNIAKDLTRIARDDLGSTARQQHIDEIATNTSRRHVAVDEQFQELPSSHLFVEHLNPEVYLPATSDINGALAKYAKIFGVPGVRDAAFKSNAFLTHLQSTTWVPLQLLRAAWTVRVVGEEQIRMAATGLSSMFHHPLSHISWMIGRKTGALDDVLTDTMQGQQALYRDSSKFTGRSGERIIARGKKIVNRGETGFGQAHADEVITLNSDPVGRAVARALADNEPLSDVKQSFIDGPLSGVRRDLGESEKFAALLADDNLAGANYYIDTVIERIRVTSGANRDVLDVIATGRYGTTFDQLPGIADETAAVAKRGPVGQRGRVKDPTTGNPISNGPYVDRDFVKFLDELPDNAKPEWLPGDLLETGFGKAPNWADRAVEVMFSYLMAKPSNLLSRSPTFRQAYWDRIAELMPRLAPDDQARLLDRAGRGGKEALPRSLRKRLSDAAEQGSGDLELELVDELAKAHGLDSTRELLYDLNRRSQFFDAARLLFPFGEAWKEVITRWAKIGVEKPRTIRRFQVYLEGARESNPFELLPGAMSGPFGSDGDPSTQGFFYTDPETGEEVFAYPWTAAINDKLLGLPFPFVGRVQGLNLAFNLIPGFGLGMQIPAALFMERWMTDPKWDPVREILFPFGEPEITPNITNLIAPAWMDKWITSFAPWDEQTRPAGEDARLLNNTIMDVAAYLVSTGDYSMDSPEEVNRTMHAAESKARLLYRFRGSFQFGAPSAPSPRFVVEADEKLIRLQVARDAYYKLFEDDPSTAVAKFMARFGEDVMFAVGPKTLSEVYSAPVTDEALAWARENPGIVEDYPLVYGLFAPQGGEFDYTAYLRQIASGERTPISAAEWTERTNNTLGTIWYDRAREKMGLSPGETGTLEQRRALADLETIIYEEYPGYLRTDLAASKVPEAVRQLTDAANDGRLPADVREFLGIYLEKRQQAIESAEAGGSVTRVGAPAFKSSERNRPIRDWLRQVSGILIEDYPLFQPFWQRIFSHELDDDKEVTSG